jgi:hypothetical protein
MPTSRGWPSDLASLNEAVHKSLTAFNDRRMSGRIESRRELFEEVEKEYLQPLPAVRFQMKDLGEIYEQAGAIDCPVSRSKNR